MTAPATARKVIRCDECATTIAEVREQGVVIKSKHFGEQHVSIITWAQLRAWLAARDAEAHAA